MKHIFVLSLLVAVAVADYCDPKLCEMQGKHIACGNSGMLSKKCPKDARIVQFTPEMIEATLDEHNKLRNEVAMGKVKGIEHLKKAKRMATMVWDDELAALATMNALQCEMKHDGCRATQQFPLAGQNLGGSYKEDNIEMMRERVSSWFAEKENCDNASIKKFTSLNGPNGKTIGHFTQVVKEDSIRVGCGATQWKDESGFLYSEIACDYAVSNIDGQPIYEEGQTASGCTSGTNSKYPGLCSEQEKFDKPWIHLN